MRKKINITQNASILNQITYQVIIFNIYKRHSLKTYRGGNLGTRMKIRTRRIIPYVNFDKKKNVFRLILSVKNHLLYSERASG